MTTNAAVAAAPTARTASLPWLDCFDRGYSEDPHRFHHQARQLSSVAVGPFGPVALSYDAVRTVLRDRRFRRPKDLGLEAQGITSGPLWERATTGLLSLDGEDHHRLRQLVSRAFSPACAGRLRAAMIDVINWLTESVMGALSCDIVTDIARPYPIPIICELLGTPRQDWMLFSAWSDEIFKLFSVDVSDRVPDILRAMDELGAYMDELVARRRHCLGGDLLSNLIRAKDDGGRLTHDELIMLACTVLTAGIDTTRNQLAAAVEVFCDHPAQWELLAAQPELAPQAVAEVMRHSPVTLGTYRTAVEDVDLAGVLIPAGTPIFACTSAANRDPSVYRNPDRFDITREAQEPMLTFGGGIHYCLGVHLAKAELAVALTTLATRMPNIRRAGPAPWKPAVGVSGPITLPVQFDQCRPGQGLAKRGLTFPCGQPAPRRPHR